MWRVHMLLILLAGPLAAQKGVAIPETVSFHGTVVAITEEQVIVSEYDWEQNKKVDITYGLDKMVKLENVASLKDIKKGDLVMFSYVKKKGKDVIFDMLVQREEKEKQPDIP